jgi:tryptophan-rich sensory protein
VTQPSFNNKDLLGLVVWLFIAYATSAIGAIGSLQAASFYTSLVQPDWAPPAWVFGPVWSVLFTMIGVSGWLIWRRRHKGLGNTWWVLFFLQLAANALWSWVFFAWRLGGLAFLDITVLAVLIVSNIWLFWRVSQLASVLLIPYLCWVCFAAMLNFSLWQLNPTILG